MTLGYLSILHDTIRNRAQLQDAVAAGRPYKPLDVEFRVNWKCNFRCKMCGLEDYAQAAPAEHRNLLETGEITALFDELAGLGCRSITLSGGEPTLRHDLAKIVEHASKKCGFRVYINTNASRTSSKKLDDLVAAGVTGFTFSMDSPIPEIHDEIRLCPGSHKKIVDSMKHLHAGRARGEHSVSIFVNCVVMKQNIETLGAFADLYREAPFDNLNFVPASIGTPWDEWATQNEHLRATVSDVREFKKNVMTRLATMEWPLKVADPFGETDEEIEQNLHVRFSGNMAPCYAPYVHAVIQNNGDVIPCCYAPDTYRIGNVRAGGFEAVWRSEGFARIRSDLKQQLYPMCASCRQYRLMNRHISKAISNNGGGSHHDIS